MLEQKQQIYGFDDFRLDVSNRQLLRDGRPVTLPAKAFDMLVVLVENGGRLIGKDELFGRVWPDQIVEESNLTVQVSAIRKALGGRKENPQYIVTVPGHGYRFIGEVSLEEHEEELMIEHHSVSRVTVETEQGTNPVEALTSVTTPVATRETTLGSRKTLETRPVSATTPIADGLPDEKRHHDAFLMIVAGGLILGLFAGGFGLWLYNLRIKIRCGRGRGPLHKQQPGN